MENKEMFSTTFKFVLAVIQLILSIVSLALCIKLLLNAFGKDADDDEKIMFLEF